MDLPALCHTDIRFLYMSSSPTNPGCILLASHEHNIHIWRPGNQFWTVEQTIFVKYFKSVISFQGKFYALHYQSGHLLSFQILPLRVNILYVPPPMDRFQAYDGDMFLVESQGNISLVCIRKPWHVDLFRHDLKNKAWNKIDSLDDQALFLNDDHMTSVSAPEAECGGNSIYSTDAWSNYAAHVYHTENRSIRSFVRMDERRRRPRKHQVWISPSLSC
ncbi:hypothetical protein MUK42_24392 [Musa troglodytarum]|uniref:KIB1-4 beta-propeller domain-containing protein n=1 Tax=Musa troglodytarum TaxID=320322 RepID=A0A9E7G891_9LILI|nr:hypothetical protein MUK42_24392 [Musa troglodytarum]